MPYKHEIYYVGDRIVFLKFIGYLRESEHLKDITNELKKHVEDFVKTHQKVHLVHNIEAFNSISLDMRSKHANWIIDMYDQLESVVFYKPSHVLSFFINSKKFFNRHFDKIKVIHSLLELKRHHLSIHSSVRSIHENEILKLLETSKLTTTKAWTHNIDNGRLTQETTLVDENIMILDVKGESVSGDVKIVGVSKELMKPHIPNYHKKFYLIFNVKDFKNQSLKRRLETYNFLESIIDDVHAVIICNAITQTLISAKIVIATKPALRNKIFFENSLEKGIAKALKMKGVEVISHEPEKSSGSKARYKWYEHLFSLKKIQRIHKLETKIETMKIQNEQHHKNTMSIIGRILWKEPFLPIPESEINNDEEREIYSALELLHQELKDVRIGDS